MSVDGQFRFGGCARRGKDEGGLVCLHRHVGPGVGRGTGQEFVPGDVSIGIERWCRLGALQYDNPLNGMPFSVQCVVDKRLQGDVLALAIGHVRRKDDARSAGHDAISKRLRSESGKNDRVDCADAGACEHEQNGFGAGGHGQCDSIALLDAEAPERCGHPHYFM